MLNKLLFTIVFCLIQSVYAQTPPLRVMLKYRSQLQKQQHAAAASSMRVSLGAKTVGQVRSIGVEIWQWEDSTLAASSVAQQLNAMDWIEYAEADSWIPLPPFEKSGETASPSLVLNDPLLGDLWGFNNTGQSGGVADADVDATEVWNFQIGKKLPIGLIDTGIDWEHEDLAENIWINAGEDIDHDGKFTPNDENGIDDDGNGYIDDVIGWDYVNNDNDPYDDVGHGTHVAGTIAAAANNGKGVVGVNWRAQLIGLKFLGKQGGRISDAVQAVEYATMMGARITNNSWGGGGYSRALYDVIRAAGYANNLFIAAAGNYGFNNDEFPNYPSDYDLDNIIAVAATDRYDVLAYYSNYSARSIDLAAPGSDVLSCVPGNRYKLNSGTSMATPFVTGAAALLWSERSDLSSSEIKKLILESVDPLPTLNGKIVTGGRLNVFKALLKSRNTLVAEPDTLYFPVTQVGNQTVQTFRIKNFSTENKTITLTTDFPVMQFSETSFTVNAQSAKDVTVTFAPNAEGPVAASITINAGGVLFKKIQAQASSLAMFPVFTVSNTVFEKRLLSNSVAKDTVQLANSGNAEMQWNINGVFPPWLSASPLGGTIPSGQTTEVVIEYHSTPLKAFEEFFYNIAFTSNDPNHPSEKVGVYVSAEQFIEVTGVNIVTDGGNSFSSNWIDYDNDGFPDLHVVNESENDFLYHNNQDGTFTRITDSGLTQDGAASSYAASWADYDNDGYADVVVINAGAGTNNALYHNNQDGTFTKVTGQIDHGDGGTFSVSGAWSDFNHDGFLDLLIANEGFLNGRYGQKNFLYYNNRNGTFSRSLTPAIAADTVWENAMTLVDHDNDGDTDVMMATWPQANQLYTQASVDQFVKTAIGNGAPNDYWGCNWADYDNDGDLDLFMTGLSQVSLNPPKLFRNDGNGVFTQLPDVAMSRHRAYFSIGCTSGDFDNDGDVDIYISNAKDFAGGPDPAFFYVNEGHMTFKRIETSVITSKLLNGLGCSFVDFDRDGDLDLFAAAGTDQNPDPENPISNNNLLYLNNGNDNHWVSVKASGVTSNRNAIGAHVHIKALINGQPVWQMRELFSISGYASQDGYDLHFGMGDATTIDSLVIDWPNAARTKTVFTNLAVDKFYTVRENGQILSKPVRTKIPEDFLLSQNYPNPFNPTTSIAYELPVEAKVTLKIFNVLGQEVRTLVNEKKNAGRYVAVWDGFNDHGQSVASGIYFYRMQTGGVIKTRKMVLLR